MNDISDVNKNVLPTSAQLLKATIAALVISAILLITTILPAEYGVDPTGAGKALGLIALNEGSSAPEATQAGDASPTNAENNLNTGANSPVWKATTAPKTSTINITLLPNQGAEVKSPMKAGDNFVFNWQTDGGAVYADMHGEPYGASGNEFTSYWIENSQSQASGNFSAPFEGTHGWYWQNKGTEPVIITLSVQGFYDDLYIP